MSNSNEMVFINQNSGYLMIDIINAHKGKFGKISLIAGKIIQRNAILGKEVVLDKIVAYDRSSALKRIFTWLWAFIQILFLIKVKYRNATLFIVTNPPFTVFLPLLCKNKFHLLVFDIYPDALVEYKIFKDDSTIVKFWKRINRKVFKKAEHIFTLSEGMKDVLSDYVDTSKIKIVPVWTDNDFLTSIPKEKNKFISKYGLENKFLVIYSGNLGYTHDLDVLVDLADRMRHLDILFVIIGEGGKKTHLQQKIDALNLTNCMMLPWQETEMLPHSLSAADLAVVSLGKEASKLSVPSKTYNLMSVGAPLLCIADQSSELASLVGQFDIGRCFSPHQLSDMVRYINLHVENQSYNERLRQNSLKASLRFGAENAYNFVVD